jgi:predicted transcriptional regulator of viral defense system
MCDAGQLKRLERGIYRLASLPALGQPDLVTVSYKIPKGVVCLLSALSYHGITTQVPAEVHVALARGAGRPRLDHPPIRTFWFSGEAFSRGIEEHDVDGVTVRIYSPEKTLADCFKYRNELGLDTFMEALRIYLRKKKARPTTILEYARVCRVDKKMRPYLEGQL